MKVLVDFSTPIPDETYIHKDSQESQKIEIEFIRAPSSVSSPTKSLEFLDMVHQVSFSAAPFNGCLNFSPEFLWISVSPTNVILLVVSEVRLPRKRISFHYF